MRTRGGQSQQRCRRQIRQQFEQLRHCQQYLSEGSPFEMDIMNQQGRQQQHLRQCCQALQNFDEKCQCGPSNNGTYAHAGTNLDKLSSETLQLGRQKIRRCL
ncbi:2S sulfur-rich seed storage protein 2-like [Coffea arabica]|uniref:2S sulfur-rich seed storage protein 2-like n=1 Tax=Coffea arabica TaxID=13443 RepID=A0A6P6TM43_COFAR|nr:2S sulfur-rich seed storage protein 2-like [Coffea arabica]XP_027078631.1 2S sulfur-rich seed storage protein 2-like [Coffea arabica]